ncbi:lactoylglutathione lyase-like lyase [Halobacteroides halobius DSM 5150]|uniref:Aldoketomutase n=1 Tax=Halobacteroides halobius (strain ATCC 35273 / DSM 5150 / MD-1) TaxID=748449 RepID=L0KB89_HALHC|nr:VOC family protein [Halobacteroides halobius]AGB41338.1 lactoylglutathione lyase-like lyase [Halobacteroides halobius DSM 5150]
MTQEYNVVHACIRVLDLEKSIKFYQTALNFEVARKRDFPEAEFTLVYLKSKTSNFELELTYNYDRKEPYTIGNGFSHLAVTVEDLEASYHKHQELGYQVSELKSLDKEASGGYYFLTDPDGYRTEVIQK